MSTKTSAPVLGFNHNLKFGPRIYHVQTEDSGLPHAHCITHLFVGGNILASMKTSYAEEASQPELQRVVRGLMESQHKAMVRRLVAGEFNEKVEQFAQHYEPGVLASGQSGPAAVNTGPSEPARMAPSAPPPQRLPTPPSAPAVKRAPPPALKPAPVQAPFPTRPSAPAQRPAALAAKATPPLAPKPPPFPPRQVTPASPSRLPGGPLPQTVRQPPPVMRPQSPPMIPQVSARGAASRDTEPSMPLAPVGKPPRQPAPPLSQNPFASQPPPATFAAEEAVEILSDSIPTLFAEELISEKSLDEVILAFLSADLEQSK